MAAPPDPSPRDKPPSPRERLPADGAAAGRQDAEGKTGQERKKLPASKPPGRSNGLDHAEQGGTDARGSQGPTGATTGSTGQGGSPGSGASSGSGGTADPR